MKKIISLLKTLPFNGRRLVVFCYAAFLAGSIVLCLFNFAEDCVQRMTGNLAPQELTVTDFDFTDLEQTGENQYRSESYDPRMTLRDVPELVRRVTVRAEFLNLDPGEFCVFYKPNPDMEEFDARYRVWAREETDGSYTFALPKGRVYGLRLDPGIYPDLEIKIQSITLNQPQSFSRWFGITRPWLLALLIAPELAASIIRYAAAIVCAVQEKTRKKEGN